MENSEESPFLKANFVSKVFFWWMNGLFRDGNRKELELEYLHKVIPADQSEALGDKLARAWKKQLESADKFKTQPSLRKAILSQFLGTYMLFGCLAFIEECFTRIAQPLFLGYLIRYFSSHEYTEAQGYCFAAGVVGTAVLFIFTHHAFFFGVQHVGMQIRVACCSVIYRKALRLSQSSLGQTTIGQMVNLLSNDVNRFDQSTVFVHYLWIGPIQTAIVTVILWNYFGPTCLVGLTILILFVPFQGYMGKLFSKMRALTAGKTDKRIRIMSEIVNGMRVIKMYTWEIPFSALVRESRKDEVKVIRKTNHLRAINMSFFFTSSKIIIFVTLLAHVLFGNALTSEKVFVTLSLYNNVRLVMMLFFPYGISQLAEALVSVKRLQKFLQLEERPVYSSTLHNHAHPATTSPSKTVEADDLKPMYSVQLENFSAKWKPEYDENTLTDINLNVKPGQLVAIIGHVGSGKGSILHAILRELPPTKGKIFTYGSIAYTSQDPWIFSGTVKQNILFGKEYDPFWYEQVVEACALKRDLTLLPYGDNTLVGDRGSSLSGGQKARLSLCRAVYANKNIYLLDDPFSALDPSVGRHIFQNCVNGLLKHTTRILVTHQLQLLKFVDHIILMSNGRIQSEGTYDQLMESGIDFAQLLHNVDDQTASPIKGPRVMEPPVAGVRRSSMKRTVSESSQASRYSTPCHGSIMLGENTLLGQIYSQEDIPTAFEDCEDECPRRKSIEVRKEKAEESVGFLPKATEETRSSGTVKLSLYWKYFKAGSSYFVLFVLVMTSLVTQVLFTGADYWLNIWTTAEEERAKLELNTAPLPLNESYPEAAGNETYLEESENSGISRDYHVIVYTIIVGIFSIASLVRTVLFFKVCMDASVNLHTSMFKGIIRAPMRFFEVNPVGRILNRFSKDIGIIDDILAPTFFDAAVIFLNVIGIVLVIGFVNVLLLIPAVILGFLLYRLRNYYLAFARQIKRLEGIARSPVFSHLSTSLYGLATVRAFEAEDEFIKQFDDHQDLHSSAWFIFICSTRWFGIWLDWITVCFIGVVTFSFMLGAPGGGGAEVGLAISSVMLLSGMFQWGVRQSAEVENQMVSVERVMEYTKLQPEAALESEKGKKPPENWPNKGEIILNKVALQYGDEAPVLKEISLVIRSFEKVGIVGRTGAGKSSLIAALFRIAEPTGEIIIDGINILKIGLHDLRGRISIIPQDPVLFAGTLRKNLDPFRTYSDIDIWKVLEEVHLADAVREMPLGLDTENAEALSSGEKQLLCLGRAILRKSCITIADEATSNVDPETDGLIQKIIREKFKNCTVLTVAHRLNTVADSDRILVLDAGRVKEFDEPYTLLQDKNSWLYQMAQETGKASADHLLKVAKEAYERRRQAVTENQ